jgi:hypothetical protein
MRCGKFVFPAGPQRLRGHRNIYGENPDCFDVDRFNTILGILRMGFGPGGHAGKSGPAGNAEKWPASGYCSQ